MYEFLRTTNLKQFMNITVIQNIIFTFYDKIHVCIYPIHPETKVNIFSNNWNTIRMIN